MNIDNNYLMGSAKRAMIDATAENLIASFLQYKNGILRMHFFYSKAPNEKEKEYEDDILQKLQQTCLV